jgi:hypothetical protein
MSNDLRRALEGFDAAAFVARHGGYKESQSPLSHEYLLTCVCGSNRLRWNAKKVTWICWGHPAGAVGRSGDTLDLICRLEGCELQEAMAIVLAGYVGGASPAGSQLAGDLAERQRRGLRPLPPIPWPAGVDRLTEPCAVHMRAWEYLAGRGITAEQVRAYGLGYGRQGRLEGRVLFPVVMDHALVFWQARLTWDPPADLLGDERRSWIERMGYRKTLNPPIVGAAATASEVLFNYDRASVGETVVVCEGPVDALKAGTHAVALLGKTAQAPKVARLRRMRASTFVVYLDRGVEERTAALALAAELSPYAAVRIAEPPEGRDAGDLSPAENAAVVAAAVPFVAGQLGGVLL